MPPEILTCVDSCREEAITLSAELHNPLLSGSGAGVCSLESSAVPGTPQRSSELKNIRRGREI